MGLPDKDHPIWKVAQSLIALVGLGILTIHGVDVVDGQHPLVDSGAVTGVATTGGAAAWFLRTLWMK